MTLSSAAPPAPDDHLHRLAAHAEIRDLCRPEGTILISQPELSVGPTEAGGYRAFAREHGIEALEQCLERESLDDASGALDRPALDMISHVENRSGQSSTWRGCRPLHLMVPALAAFVACTSSASHEPAAPHEAPPSHVTTPQPPCTQFVRLEDLQPFHELHAPMACGNSFNETFSLVIAPDGHVLSADDHNSPYPNWSAVSEIKSWVFRPTLIDGIPTSVCVSFSRRPTTYRNEPQICPAS